MSTAQLPSATEDKAGEEVFPRHRGEGSALMVLLGIVALLYSGLELEVLMAVDGMMRFMTVREILWDVGAAFIPVFGMALGWWLCLILLMKIAAVLGWKASSRDSVLWRLGLVVPLIYFVLELFNSTRLRVSPHC